MKNIRELTNDDAVAILTELEKDWVFDKLSFDPIINEKGEQQLTFSGSSIIGICYRSGPNLDGYIKHFSDLKVMKWLYQHNFDIEELIQDRIESEEEDEAYRDHFFKERDEMLMKIKKYEMGAKNEEVV